MKISELFARIDRSPSNLNEPNADHWASEFDITVPWDSNVDDKLAERMQGYWAIKWYCTDTWVGVVLYFLDGEPLGITTQKGRKCDTEIEFVSKEMALKLRDLLYELCKKDEPEDNFALIDMDEEIGEDYTIAYGGQLLVHDGVYCGQPAKVVQTFDGYDEIEDWTNVVVETEGGQTKISMRDFRIPYPLAADTKNPA